MWGGLQNRSILILIPEFILVFFLSFFPFLDGRSYDNSIVGYPLDYYVSTTFAIECKGAEWNAGCTDALLIKGTKLCGEPVFPNGKVVSCE